MTSADSTAHRSAYRFEIARDASFEEAQATLHLSLIALEGLVGRTCVKLDTRYRIDAGNRAIVVQTETETGLMLARLFGGMLLTELGSTGFEVTRMRMPDVQPDEESEDGGSDR